MNYNTKHGSAPCAVCHTAPDPVTGVCLCPREAAMPANSTAGPLVAQAESLFETYLAARLVRARRNLSVAKVALLRDPRSRAKLEDFRRAESEAERLQAQLVEQARKSVQAREGSARTDGHGSALGAHRDNVSAEATVDFRAVQAIRAEEAYPSDIGHGGRRSRPDDRDCPSCGNRVSGDLSACTCGHEFTASSAGVPAEPFLTDDELAALRGGVKVQKRAE